MMRSSYAEEDVTLLLKDISGLVEPLPAAVREQYIQQGVHYCEMLPLEYRPSEIPKARPGRCPSFPRSCTEGRAGILWWFLWPGPGFPWGF